MSAKSVLLWATAAAIALTTAALLRAEDVPLTSLDASLGPQVTTEPL